ncbi:MAG TPA: hypothetical protein VFD58_07860 [Blastocatellia bacterium]|nr:hypothetical protein [Blastocatellia bacterium]
MLSFLHSFRHAFALLFICAILIVCPASIQRPDSSVAAHPEKRGELQQIIDRITEPSGYFGSDNLVSNELSYQHVLSRMQQDGVSGGAYIGVGPDQNFTYIAHIKPRIAFMIDIRRDCNLQHFMFKAVFHLARNRAEYLALLFGKPLPKDLKKWEQASISDLVVNYVDRTPSNPKLIEKNWTDIRKKIQSFNLTLNQADYDKIREIYNAFTQSGLEVRYTIRDRPSGRFFPAFRDLLLEKDLEGRQRNYLASEESYQFLKKMQERNLIIPVTGDLSGTKALREIGKYLQETGDKVSAFYTSNVEFYLFRQDNAFQRFVENVKYLPIDKRSVIIRSYFNYAYYAYQHPQTVDNHFSVQLLQTIDSLVRDMGAGGYDNYYDLVTKRSLDLRTEP